MEFEPQTEHAPVLHFAQAGYDWVAARPEVRRAVERGEDVACRRLDLADAISIPRSERRLIAHRAIAAQLATPPNGEGNSVNWLGLRLGWFERLPQLKTWAGGQSLHLLIRERQSLLPAPLECPLEDVRGPSKSTSGFDARTVATAIDVGFNARKVGRGLIDVYPAVELLAILGAEVSPIICFGHRAYGYVGGGRTWAFETFDRGSHYYKVWGTARPLS